MADDKTVTDSNPKTGKVKWADRERIDIDQEYALRDWSAKLGVTHWEVKAAVRKVGPKAKDVARVLGSNARI
jgi:hypothetical protein